MYVTAASKAQEQSARATHTSTRYAHVRARAHTGPNGGRQTSSPRHVHYTLRYTRQPPSKGSLRGSKCTPLCNSQLPACKPIVCRGSQVSKSYIDAEQRHQRSSILDTCCMAPRARANDCCTGFAVVVVVFVDGSLKSCELRGVRATCSTSAFPRRRENPKIRRKFGGEESRAAAPPGCEVS